ncbi:MAG: hypothetical protein EBS78_11245 [Altererythrobacter sp.]|jgi:hypothetical protein|nr:hypothetical protein [Altererythrobacter sp.]
MPNDAFKFPDEQEQTEEKAKGGEVTADVEVEIVDDTPPQDRGRDPLPKEIVKELEDDTLDEYSDKVKKRLSQMKKVWHDERREKERAAREREEALRYAEAKSKEVIELRKRLGDGERRYKDEATKAAQTEIASAKDKLRQAYEANDPVQIADAQEALTDAKLRMKEVEYFRPSLQEQEKEVETEQQVRAPTTVDQKAEAWRERNTWFGVDEEMTALALGLHEKLVRSGVDPRSDEYYRRVDERMRKLFPDAFESSDDVEEEQTQSTEVEVEKPAPRKKPNVVAPASRSTAPKKVRLTQTQLALARKFGLTPEAYAKELIKLENYNG